MPLLPTPATDADLKSVMQWLWAEEQDTGIGFWRNQQAIQKSFEEGRMRVLRSDDGVVAFITGRPWYPEILEVRPDCRGQGFGRVMAEHIRDQAIAAGACLIRIECQPPTSIPFWERMGFRLIDEDGDARYIGGHAYMPLPQISNDEAGSPIEVEIGLYPTARLWGETAEPILLSQQTARVREGRMHLPERVILISPKLDGDHDLALRIVVGGEQIFLDKVKREAAWELGVTADPGRTYFIDSLVAPDQIRI